MGLLGDIVNRTKDELKYTAGSELGYGIRNTARKGFEKIKGKKSENGDKKCPKCKKPYADGLKFCQSCGAKLTSSCAKCNVDFPMGTKFCGQCGGELK